MDYFQMTKNLMGLKETKNLRNSMILYILQKKTSYHDKA